jgi:predicted transcriptional regulator
MAKRMGRPPAGRDADGRPVPTRSYPQLTVRIRPGAKEDLDLLADHAGVSQGAMIERAIDAYMRSLPASTKKTLEGMRADRARGEKG